MTMLVSLTAMKNFLGISVGTTYPEVLANLTIATATNRITRAAGSWVTDGVNVGTQLILTDFVNAGNNITVTVSSVISATVIELVSDVGMVDEVMPTATFQKVGTASTTTYDQFLTDQITFISDAIEGYCGRAFIEDEYVQNFYQDEILDSDMGQKELILYHYPVTAVASVEVGDPLAAVGEYRLHGPSGTLRRVGGWRTVGDIEATYTAGFDIADIPTPIQQVVFNLVQERYNKKIAGVDLNFGSNVQRVSIPGVISLDYDYTLTTNDRNNRFGMFIGDYANILDHYRSNRVVLGDIRSNYVGTA